MRGDKTGKLSRDQIIKAFSTIQKPYSHICIICNKNLLTNFHKFANRLGDKRREGETKGPIFSLHAKDYEELHR
jgi:hypothetical protein